MLLDWNNKKYKISTKTRKVNIEYACWEILIKWCSDIQQFCSLLPHPHHQSHNPKNRSIQAAVPIISWSNVRSIKQACWAMNRGSCVVGRWWVWCSRGPLLFQLQCQKVWFAWQGPPIILRGAVIEGQMWLNTPTWEDWQLLHLKRELEGGHHERNLVNKLMWPGQDKFWLWNGKEGTLKLNRWWIYLAKLNKI